MKGKGQITSQGQILVNFMTGTLPIIKLRPFNDFENTRSKAKGQTILHVDLVSSQYHSTLVDICQYRHQGKIWF